MWRHRVVGLLDEQVRVVQVVPRALASHQTNAFSDQVTWHESPWPAVRRWRLAKLCHPLTKMGVDLIHAVSGCLWAGAVRLANQLGAPLVLEIHTAADLDQTQHLRHIDDATPLALIATTQPLADELQRRINRPHAIVERIAPGVHLSERPWLPSGSPDAFCAIVSGNGVMDDDYESLLEAIRWITRDYPQAQFFFDSGRGDQHALWQAAQRHGLLTNLSLLPPRPGDHQALLQGDLFIQPQALGRSRSLTLQAMAHGVPVVARADAWLDYLITDKTAWLVTQPNPEHWAQVIRRAVQSPSQCQTLCHHAKQWVRQHHLAATQVGRLISLYHRVAGESIKFPQNQESP